MLNADLHTHSNISDGTMTPEGLAARAKERGVQLWALTDHDELDGIPRARAAAQAHGLPYLTGTEVSVTFADTTVHIVGLGFDEHAQGIVDGLARTRGGRLERAKAMGDSLARAGIPGAYEGALKYVSNPDLIARTHFARFLVEAGHAAENHEVFRRFLTEGKPGFVPHRWAALEDAVRWITEAGGVAVIAHPGRYDFTPAEEDALFTEFKRHGGLGVEVITGSHTVADYDKYAAMAQAFDLLASRGSDFHGPGESRVDMGELPDLPARLKPVWEALESRVQRPS